MHVLDTMRRIAGIVATAALFCCLATGQGRRSILRGHIRPALRTATDLGRAPEAPLTGLQLVFALSAERQADLDRLLVSQQDPASPDFHRWLTPEAFAARFGASDADINTAVAWLESRGLRIVSIARGRTAITFNGTVRKAEAAFGVQLHRFLKDGETHFANVSEPSVGAELEGKVASIRGLHDFRMRHPRYTSASGNHYLSPDDYAVLYNLKPLYAQKLDGTGQKLAVVGQSQVTLADIRLFRTNFGLSPADPQITLVGKDPGIVPRDLGEALLDIEWAGAIARNASILYYYSVDVTDALYRVIDENLAPVISMSYGLCEAEAGVNDLTLLQSYAKRAAAQGITWLAASGDSGAADCFSGTSATVAQLAVDAPASIPEVTGVGGTTFTEGSGTYWNALNDANKASVLSYIPETAWNDSGSLNLSASGGGASSFFAKPAWQTGAGVPNDNARDVPDISLSASAAHVGYLVYQNGSLFVVGGTSAGTPAFAGIVALLNQYQVANGLQSSPGMGNINPRLYSLAATTPGVFHDITTGGNLVNPCSSRVQACTAANIGYSAGPGYDQVTGLGTVDATNLVTNWGGVAPKTAVTITLSSSAPVVSLSGATILTARVAGATATTPTGSVSFFTGPVQLGTATLAGSGGVAIATLTVPASSFGLGSNSFTARYNGDAAYNPTISAAGSLEVTAATSIVITGAVNAGSYKSTVAPGMILAVFGSFLAGSAQSAATVPLPTTLGGVTAFIDSIAAPLYYVSPDQINLQIPYGVNTGNATLRVSYNGQTASRPLGIALSAPGIFINTANGAPVPDQSAKRGQTITLYTTGEGSVFPQPVSGALPGAGTTPKPLAAVSVIVGGIPAVVTYYGVPAWAIGAMQINYTVPANAPPGDTQVTVTIGGLMSAPATLTIIP